MKIARGLVVVCWLATLFAAGQERPVSWLEIPEFQLRMPSNTRAALPRADFGAFRIQLPWHSDRLPYGNIQVTLNGESLNRAMEPRDSAAGIICEFDLRRVSDLHLRKGINTVEVTADDRYGRNYRVSFVLEPSGLGAEDFNRWVILEVVNLSRASLKCCYGPMTSSDTALEYGSLAKVSVRNGELAAGNLTFAVLPTLCRAPLAVPRYVKGPEGESVAHVEIQDADVAPCLGMAAAANPPATPATEAPATALHLDDVDEPPRVSTVNAHAYGLVIGVEHYKGAVPAVPHALNDASVMRKYMTGVLGVPEEHIKFLADPGLSDLKVGFAWLRNQAKAEADPAATLFVYYAGHGVPDAETHTPFLLPVDGNPAYISETGYPIRGVSDLLGSVPGRSIIILDACFSGTAARGAAGGAGLTGGKRPAYIAIDMPQQASVIMFSAAQAAETSNALPEARHGLFTYYLLSGLHGKAADAQGVITLGSLFDYVRRQVETTATRLNQAQTPTLSPDAASSRDLILVSHQQAGQKSTPKR